MTEATAGHGVSASVAGLWPEWPCELAPCHGPLAGPSCSEPKLAAPGEEPGCEKGQVPSASDRDSRKCRQRSLGISTRLTWVNMLPLGSPISVTPAIAGLPLVPSVLPLRSFKIRSNAVSRTGDWLCLPALSEEVSQSRIVWTVSVDWSVLVQLQRVICTMPASSLCK